MDAHHAMTETHRHLLQFLMAHRFQSEDDLRDKLENYKLEHQYGLLVENMRSQNTNVHYDKTLEEFIGTINRALSLLHFKIVKTKHPKTRKILYTIINELDDEISKLSTRFSPDELTFFKTLIEALADEQDISKLTANSNRPKTLSMEAADIALDAFIEEGWLEEINGKLALGIRSITDLETVISELTAMADEEPATEEVQEEDE
ncbi:hypothetical protein FDP41_005142 [Naegleria fowleri]|uniref:Non-structural maintenance of chromosomes element 1 homolog n=1 Tax=Naegleria fowleri TaxID=5763 RepID=A0A6A5BQV8_NAEFO|nr:uncharacterized protein FDP41_005142 [Naegleria fowleri]KAF0975815.1 hypothetical protein FDP41_005142 [Naegleria fowleri]CAG4708477.1 unnamed protein product [Naegleria fowleri]